MIDSFLFAFALKISSFIIIFLGSILKKVSTDEFLFKIEIGFENLYLGETSFPKIDFLLVLFDGVQMLTESVFSRFVKSPSIWVSKWSKV